MKADARTKPANKIEIKEESNTKDNAPADLTMPELSNTENELINQNEEAQKALSMKLIHKTVQIFKSFLKIFPLLLSVVLYLQPYGVKISQCCWSALKFFFSLLLWPLHWLCNLSLCGVLVFIAIISCTYDIAVLTIFCVIPIFVNMLKFINPYLTKLTKICFYVLKFLSGLIWFPLLWLCGWFIEERPAPVQVTPPPQLQVKVEVEVQVEAQLEHFPAE